MQPADDAARRPEPPSTHAIQRAFWIVLALLFVVLVSFAAYYVSDRYVHRDEKAPIELDVEYLEGAVRERPQDPVLRITLAESYLRAGSYVKALEQANQVLSLYPDNVSALLIAGISEVRLDRPEAALEPLRRFVELRKDGTMARSDTALEAAYYYLGECYIRLGQPAEAIPLLEEALLINSVDADALYQLGLALDATGQPEPAVQRYRQAVRLVPDFAEAYQAMARSYTALNRPDHVAYATGMVAYCQKDYEAAAPSLERATEALPDFAPAFVGLGLVYEAMERPEAALPAIERALELDPGDYAALQALGRIEAALQAQN